MYQLISSIQEILGGGEAASRFYSDTIFKEFRSKNIVQAAVDFARVSQFKSIWIFSLIFWDID